jgi:RHS repeat-associated protein
MQIYSNAFNFDSYLTGGVDLRTGQYTCSIQLATITPEGAAEAGRDISLSFSMMEANDSGYGLGWTLSGSSFNLNTRHLKLITGQRYTSDPLPNVNSTVAVRLRDYRSQDLVFRRGPDNDLHVLHKDGVLEVLRQLQQGPIFSLVQLVFENGERFNFEYQRITGVDCLGRITNAETQRVHLGLSYNNNLLWQADALQENGRLARTHFTYLNNELRSVSVPVEINAPSLNRPFFRFEYEMLNDYRAIRRFQNPMGGQDLVQHWSQGHRTFNNQFIPVVTQLTSLIGGGSPAVVHSYIYSQDANFTGFPQTIFLPDQDNLYQQVLPYSYWCRDQVQGATPQQKRVTFNRFHLQTEEITIRAGTQYEQRITYNEILNQVFADQPANLHSPSRISTIFRQGTAMREELTLLTTDQFGNELTRTEPSGIRHEFSYYPIAGVAGRCPPEPRGLFQRFLRQERTVPTSGGGAPPVIDHTYLALSGFANGVPYVVPETTTVSGLSNRFSYLSSANVLLHGLPSESQLTLNNHITRAIFSYSVSGDVLTETRIVRGFDHAERISQRSFSVVNQLLLSMRKDNAVTVAFTYDINGRILTETLSPGTPNQAIHSYVYQFADGAIAANVVTTDVLSGRYITRYDGMSRVVSVAQLVGTSEQRQRVDVYDQLGQLIEQHEFDHIDDQEIRLTTQYAYDGWGHQERTTRPDSSQVIDRYNPIARIREQGIVGSSILRSEENRFDKPFREVLVATNNQTAQIYSREFDGLGRCVSEANVDNLRGSFVYDNFDRITTETQIPAEGGPARVIAYAYPAHLVEGYASSLAVNNIVLGQRVYDGVGRLLTQTRGNAAGTTSWTYLNRALRPHQIGLPDGQVQQLQYNVQLDRIMQINAGNQVTEFGVHPVTGSLTSMVNAESQHSLQHDAQNRVISEAQSINGQTFSNTYRYSTAGRLTQHVTALGDTEARVYDAFGRFSSARITGGTAGASEISVSYDAAGRINVTTVATSNGICNSTLTYDVFGREARREIRQSGLVLQLIETAYYPNSKISSRRITGAGGLVVSNESFTYDGFGRLVEYGNTGAQYATDQRGRSIRSQRFTYDVLNNITQVITSLLGEPDDVVTRRHQHADPTQLSQITGTNPSRVINLTYDRSGQLIQEATREFQFNNMGQLTQVSNHGQVRSSYGYDAAGRQVSHSDEIGNRVGLHYSAERVIGVSQGSVRARYVRHEETVLARSISGMGSEINGSDGNASVRMVTSGSSSVRHVSYAPYGMSGIDEGSGSLLQRSRPVFNGERYDPLGQLYHLGNGRRAYSPELMIFLSPDPLSPFDEGGLNSYGYCGGDPVNFIDPSGLSVDVVKLVAMGAFAVLGVLGLGAGILGLKAIWAKSKLKGIAKLTHMAADATVTGLSASSIGTHNEPDSNGMQQNDLSRGLAIGAAATGTASIIGHAASFVVGRRAARSMSGAASRSRSGSGSGSGGGGDAIEMSPVPSVRQQGLEAPRASPVASPSNSPVASRSNSPPPLLYNLQVTGDMLPRGYTSYSLPPAYQPRAGMNDSPRSLVFTGRDPFAPDNVAVRGPIETYEQYNEELLRCNRELRELLELGRRFGR